MRALAALATGLCLAAAAPLAQPGGPAAADGSPGAQASIVGGHKADPHAWGFAVALRERGFGYFCTGSLIAPDRVLTAAHCVRRSKPRRMRVIVGSPWSAGPRARPSYRVRRVRIDPDYRPRLDRRDVAVITLRSSDHGSGGRAGDRARVGRGHAHGEAGLLGGVGRAQPVGPSPREAAEEHAGAGLFQPHLPALLPEVGL